MSAVRPKPFGKSTLAPRFSSSLTISGWSLDAAACSRPKAEARPSRVEAEQSASTGPPFRSHLTTICSSPFCADSTISTGSGSEELTTGSPASGAAVGEAALGCGGAACCRMRATMAVWPSASAHCRAVRLFPSSSSVLALARSRAFMDASCPW
eukprot:scaffold2747_cov60-Phaeocystis_antarctica.AAC.2